MEEEIGPIHENQTYDLVCLPLGRKVFKNKWVFKLKPIEGSLQPRYKARLIIKGFEQKFDIDFDEKFSLVVKMTHIRVVLGLAANLDLEIEQFDIKTAFLDRDLKEKIFMEQL